MSFNFLPQLPKPNLDDRKFNDLVEECLLRIPRYCPEWTNHNPSDPGITLIELFAWLTDQMLFRFNQVPYRNYIVFLELLGIRLQPPAPAQTAVTFYLSQAQTAGITLPYSTEAATLRTENDPAVIFSTEQELVIGTPQIKHLLTAEILEERPQQWSDRTPIYQSWDNFPEQNLFENSALGNCFYLVLEAPHSSIQGNVLALNIKGVMARVTGINPDDPPRQWQAWNGQSWESILRTEADDYTKGFSFSEMGTSTNSVQDGADVILHLPQHLPEWEFGDFTNVDGVRCRGYWIRCVYTKTKEMQDGYSISPSIVGLSVRAIGGTVNASQCVRVERELLGISTGKPGQTFELQGKPVLERQGDRQEHIELVLPTGEVQQWVEVKDFADSGAEDPHYTLDSLTGTVQFGPLIREPAQLRQKTQQRALQQAFRDPLTGHLSQRNPLETRSSDAALPLGLSGSMGDLLERQYGKVPPLGAEIYMAAYRTGGGSQGNVQAEKLTVLRSAIPYVKRVVNYTAAVGGVDAESLDEAVLRVPHILRTRESAVIPADFEKIARDASRAVARAHCLSENQTTAGIVRLMIVPQVPVEQVDWQQGLSPDRHFLLNEALKTEILTYMGDRKPLGIQVKLQEPEYVGVSVRLKVLLDPTVQTAEAEDAIQAALLQRLYRFLNPLTGGLEGQGWRLGHPLYPADLFGLYQAQPIPGVRHLALVELFELRKYGQEWFRTGVPQPSIDPGSLGLICSWDEPNSDLQSGHQIEFVD
jgi:predicted phage baseplate assembly protein